VLNEILGLHNEPKAAVHSVHKLTGPKKKKKKKKRDQLTGEWSRLHYKELNDLYSSPSIFQEMKSRRMRLAGHVARLGERRGVFRFLVGKPEGKKPLGRHQHRW